MGSLLAKLAGSGRLDSLLARKVPDLEYSGFEISGSERVSIQFLGTASFVIEGAGKTLVFDPYVSRPSLKDHLHPLQPDREKILREFPRADDVFVGHAHSDHILDAPDLCLTRQARLIGSRSVCRTGRAAGVPEELLYEVQRDGEVIGYEDHGIEVTALASRHGLVTESAFLMSRINRDLSKYRVADPNRNPVPMFEDMDGNFGVTFPRETSEDMQWPAYTWEFGCGQVYDWLVEIEGMRIMHVDSARLEESEFRGRRADVVCLCALGRQHSPGFTRQILEELRPRVIIPCHWDNFFVKPDPTGRLVPLASARIRKWIRELQGFVH
ncbi:MAG: MBL fold metallo-hydrolase, partial [Verrucomicrobiota bacterium]